MSLGHKYLLLDKQSESEKQTMCRRCSLPYDRELLKCPHCAGMNDDQLEEILQLNRKRGLKNQACFVLILTGLILLFFLAFMYK